MKITIIGPAYPFRGGLASFNERLAYELQDMGHEVKIYTFTQQYPDFLFPGKTQFSESKAPENLEIYRKVHAYNPLNWGRVGALLRKEKPDLILTRFWIPFIGPSLGKIIKIAKKNGHTRTVAIIDNIIPHEHRIGDKQLANYFTKQIDRFVVMSKSVQKEMKDFTNNQPVVYSPHPIYDIYGKSTSREEALLRLKLDATKKYILFFGFIRDYKGLDLLLKAMAEDVLRKRDIHLIVAGEYYANEADYTALIEKLKIKDRLVLFNSFIPNEQVKYYFSVADLVVQPYKTATQSGISQVAMHFEVPMVVTDVGGLKEVVKDNVNGFLTQKDPAAIARTIVKYFHEDKKNTFKEQIALDKEQYSWRFFAQAVLGNAQV